ncbi:sugar transferase [Mycolicibacterium sp. CBM1]
MPRVTEPLTPLDSLPSDTRFARAIRTEPLRTITLVSLDTAAATVAVIIGVKWAVRANPITTPIWMPPLFVALVIVFLALRSVYRRGLDRRFVHEIGAVTTSVALAAIVTLSVLVFAGLPGHLGALVPRVWVCAATLILGVRLITSMTRRRLCDHHYLLAPTLIIGNGQIAHQIVDRLTQSPEYGLAPVGLLSADAPWRGSAEQSALGIPWIGTPDDIEEAIRDTRAEAVLIAFSRVHDQLLTRSIRAAHQHDMRVWVVPRMFDVVGERARVDHLGGLPLLALPHTNPRGWQFAVKHLTDRLLAAAGLLIISPVFLALVGLVKASSPGPVFFRQERVGRDGQIFECLKFRTMRADPAPATAFSPGKGSAPGGVEGQDRRTTIGKVLRSTSLDELPQLINVVKGEMSLVGPRPERPEFVELFETQIRRYGERHRVKAGLTGWAQVHGLRGQTSIADRAEWDNYYVENWSLSLDFKILAMTVLAVLRGAE